MEEEEEKMRLVKMETRDVEEKRDGKEEHQQDGVEQEDKYGEGEEDEDDDEDEDEEDGEGAIILLRRHRAPRGICH